jgi:hypothetical protein
MKYRSALGNVSLTPGTNGPGLDITVDQVAMTARAHLTPVDAEALHFYLGEYLKTRGRARFVEEVIALEKKYNMTIEHESYGAFYISDGFTGSNLEGLDDVAP